MTTNYQKKCTDVVLISIASKMMDLDRILNTIRIDRILNGPILNNQLSKLITIYLKVTGIEEVKLTMLLFSYRVIRTCSKSNQ